MLVVKIIHFLSLAIGLGGSAAGLLIAIRAGSAAAEVRPVLMGLQRLIGRIAFGCIILLWLTGIGLVYHTYGGWSGLGAMFWVKIASVVALTVAAATIQVFTIRAQISRTPPPRPIMMRLALAANGAATLAVIFAVLAFG